MNLNKVERNGVSLEYVGNRVSCEMMSNHYHSTGKTKDDFSKWLKSYYKFKGKKISDEKFASRLEIYWNVNRSQYAKASSCYAKIQDVKK